MTPNHLLPSTMARSKVGRLNAAQSAAKWTSGAKLRRCGRSNLGLTGSSGATRFEAEQALSMLACAFGRPACSVQAKRAQVSFQSAPTATPARFGTGPLPNPSLELTRSGRPPWPRGVHVYHAPRGQGVLPPRSAQLKR